MTQMKIWITVAGMLLAAACLAQGEVAVTVTDIESNKGKIILMLFEDAEGFPSDKEKAFRRAKIDAKEGEIFYRFEDVPFGTYAVTVGHDENDNDEMDRNFVGFPKERVGVSFQTKFGKPSFNRSQFDLSSGQARQEIRLTFIN